MSEPGAAAIGGRRDARAAQADAGLGKLLLKARERGQRTLVQRRIVEQYRAIGFEEDQVDVAPSQPGEIALGRGRRPEPGEKAGAVAMVEPPGVGDRRA